MDEIRLWTVEIGDIRPFAFGRLRGQWEAAQDFIRHTHGFVGVQHGKVLMYRTEDDARRARDELTAHGCMCGNNICEIYVQGGMSNV